MSITGVNITSSDDISGQLLENLMLNSLWEKKGRYNESNITKGLE